MIKQPTAAASSDAVARYLAEKGEARIVHHQAIVDRARQMLENGEVSPAADGADPHRPPPYLAEVREGLGALPYSTLFLSPALRKSLAAFDRGEGRPGAMSFMARYHSNYS